MFKIAYIEPYQDLVLKQGHSPHIMLNHNFASRLEGLRQEILEQGDISFFWLNNEIQLIDFLQTKKYLDYDATLITAPDKAAIQLISNLQKDYIFLVSADTSPGLGINYVGPDHKKDIEKMLGTILYEGQCKIDLIVSNSQWETSMEVFSLVKDYLIKNKIGLHPSNVIGYDMKSGKNNFQGIAKSDVTDLIIEEILKRKETDVFLFVDSGPLSTVYHRLVKRHKIRIPEDIKLATLKSVGLFPDNVEHLTGTVSRISQDYYSIGKLSIRCLHEILIKKRQRTDNRILVPGKFTYGKSISSTLINNQENPDQFKKNIEHYINNNFAKNITIKKISADLELSYNYFITKFKSVFGYSINDYINKVRLDKAAHLISNSHESFLSILKEVGYTNESTFIRQFKKQFKKTPSEYRQTQKTETM